MRTISATELARNLSAILDRLAADGQELVIERNHRALGRLVPGPPQMTALEAMGDLYHTLPEEAASGWEKDSRASNLKGDRIYRGIRDPWHS